VKATAQAPAKQAPKPAVKATAQAPAEQAPKGAPKALAEAPAKQAQKPAVKATAQAPAEQAAKEAPKAAPAAAAPPPVATEPASQVTPPPPPAKAPAKPAAPKPAKPAPTAEAAPKPAAPAVAAPAVSPAPVAPKAPPAQPAPAAPPKAAAPAAKVPPAPPPAAAPPVAAGAPARPHHGSSMHGGPHVPPPRARSPQVEFKAGDYVVYPTHGVGQVQGIEDMPVAGMSLKVIIVTFEENRMTLRVPVNKASSSGLRKLATQEVINEALEVLRGRARIKRTMWSRRAQEYEQKINSGDPLAIAEVVRDLHRNAGQPDQSFSERQIYEQALDRLAAELAAIDRTDKPTAAEKLQVVLKSA
jgi:CarD family transcriptional regulator